MANQQHFHYQPESDYDTARNSFPPPRQPHNPPPRGSNGYQVAPVSSYLPSLSSPPSPPVPSHGSNVQPHRPLPSLNPYLQTRRQYNPVPSASDAFVRGGTSPTRLQDPNRRQDGHMKMSAYRQQRIGAAAEASAPGDYFGQQQQQSHNPHSKEPPAKRTSPVVAQTQAKPFHMPRSPDDVPSVPQHTLLDYGQDGHTNTAYHAGRNMAPLLNASEATPYTDHRYSSPERHPSPYQHSNDSRTGLLPAAAVPGLVSPIRPGSALSTVSRSYSPLRSEYARSYTGNQRSEYAPSVEIPNRTTALGAIDPMEIADDDDDPFPGLRAPAVSGPGSGFIKNITGRDTSGSYGQIPGSGLAKNGASIGISKSEWTKKEQKSRSKRGKWLICMIVTAVILILGITGAVLGPVLVHNLSHSSSSSNTTSTSTTSGGGSHSGAYLTSSSPEVVALLNNPSLHKVFPGMDYTPQNSQYPDCLTSPPSQNNITKDLAILTQLTPLIRLYGTDCNISAMALASLSFLDVKPEDTKLMLGVWLDNNATTNTRQLDQLYSTLKSAFSSSSSSSSNLIANTISSVAGVIVGNEVLFRADMTESQLISTITTVRSNLSSLGYGDLPIGTAELGSQWSAELADAVDLVGANVHPFFAGVTVNQAATWTYNYWQTHDVNVVSSAGTSYGYSTTSTSTNNQKTKTPIIAETGWPSSGGYNLGSIAGTSELNTFLSTWVCESLTNGTQYWWFEAFDEGWKKLLDSDSETDGQVESHWGLFGSGDGDGGKGKWELKDGVVIPECGGKVAKSVF